MKAENERSRAINYRSAYCSAFAKHWLTLTNSSFSREGFSAGAPNDVSLRLLRGFTGIFQTQGLATMTLMCCYCQVEQHTFGRTATARKLAAEGPRGALPRVAFSPTGHEE